MERYLVVADPLASLDPTFDLGIATSQELLRRGVPVDYLDLLASDADLDWRRYLGALPVREIRAVDPRRRPSWELGPVRETPVEAYGVILQRKDPPVDDLFVQYCKLFEHAPSRIVQINRPPATYQLSEHTAPLRFPEFAVETLICEDAEALVEAVRSLPGETVCKPLHTCSGIGVSFFAHTTSEVLLRQYWDSWGPTVIVQPYLPAIERSGDLRVLTIGRHVLGAVLRVPAPGSRLANLHRGASAAYLEPTRRQLDACQAVAAELNPMGLHLLGLDFIGEHLTEINFTSPTTIVQINQVMGKRADVELVDALEQMRLAAR